MYPSFHIKTWEDIHTDIDCAFPRFMNIRKSDEGVQTKTSKQYTEGRSLGGNLHCIIEFERLDKPVKLTEVEEEQEKLREDGGAGYRKFITKTYKTDENQQKQAEEKEPL